MDIDIHTIRKETLSNTVSRILDSTPFHSILRARQIEIVNATAPKQTDTTQRWKIQLKVPSTLIR